MNYRGKAARFKFLQKNYGELYQLCADAEKYAKTDEAISMLKARQAIEYMARCSGSETNDLFGNLSELEHKKIASPRIIKRLHFIRVTANKSVHATENADVEKVLDALKEICFWFMAVQKKKRRTLSRQSGEVRHTVKKRSRQEVANSKYKLGIKYYYGNNVQKDYVKARKWFQEAAELGHADAQHKLGLMYRFGNGVSQDYEKAEEWFRKAAAQGHENAKQQLLKSQRKRSSASLDSDEGHGSRYWILFIVLLIIVCALYWVFAK